MYLYMHICPNGKKYVGITIQEPNQRWRDGKRVLQKQALL